MADQNVSGLSTPTGGPASDDEIYLVDVSDTTDGADGSSRKTTLGEAVSAASNIIIVTSHPYNATGDGTTDDTTAIQSAIDAAAAAGGGTVFVPGGAVYRVTTLTVDSPDVELLLGPGAVLETTSVSGVTVGITGARSSIRGGTIRTVGVATGATHVLLSADEAKAIMVRSEDGFRGVQFNTSQHMVAKGCVIIDALDVGIRENSAVESSILDNHIVGCAEGIYLATATEPKVRGNTVDGTTSANGIEVSAATVRAEISGNLVKNATANGILALAANSTIQGNTIVDCCSGAADGALKLQTGANYCAVVGNTIRDSTGTQHEYGIELTGGADRNTIQGNTIEGYVTASMILVNSSNRVDGNSAADRTENSRKFRDSADGNISLQVAPTAVEEDSTVADAGTLTLDYEPPASSFVRITFLVTFGNAGSTGGLYAFDRVVVARRLSTNAPTVQTDKAIFEAADYGSPPTVTVAASVSGNNIRMTVTNNDGAARYCKIAVSSIEDLL